MQCSLCERIEKIRKGQYPFLIQELKHGYFLLGEHQYYQGYCLLLSKTHHKEMTDLPPGIANEFFQEMMLVHRAIEKVFHPKKMNLESLGNVVPHVHWHFFPRYADDPQFKNPPFLQMQHFDSAKVSADSARETIERLRRQLQILSSSVS